MTNETLVGIVGRLFVAAGRRPPGRVDYDVWREVIGGCADDALAEEVGRSLVAVTDADRPPTPAAFLTAYRAAADRRAMERPRLPSIDPLGRETQLERVRAARALLRRSRAPGEEA